MKHLKSANYMEGTQINLSTKITTIIVHNNDVS